jgi:NAD(P)-dependent dehydrogenase (short-subunit alcohol dehydrogenase family)
MLAQQRGAIVLLSSIHALATYPCRVPYATAKAAIVGMARGLAVEWGPHNIRVNAVCPWQIEGPRTQAFIDAAPDDLRETYQRRVPTRQLITPEAVAQTVLWLVQTPGITGQAIVMDGGLTASAWHYPFQERETEP